MRRERQISRFAALFAFLIVASLGLRSFLERPERAAASGEAGSAAQVPVKHAAAREVFTGKVIGVSDGDTLSVLRRTDSGESRAVKVRLDGIDCPESRQAFGSRAKQMTSSLAFGKDVRVEVRDVDRYSRLVARVVLPDGRDLSKELVRVGLAWWYRKYSNDPELEALEAEAREARRGLWGEEAAARTAPWEYRQAARTR